MGLNETNLQTSINMSPLQGLKQLFNSSINIPPRWGLRNL